MISHDISIYFLIPWRSDAAVCPEMLKRVPGVPGVWSSSGLATSSVAETCDSAPNWIQLKPVYWFNEV